MVFLFNTEHADINRYGAFHSGHDPQDRVQKIKFQEMCVFHSFNLQVLQLQRVIEIQIVSFLSDASSKPVD